MDGLSAVTALRPSAAGCGDRADLLHEAHHVNRGLRLGDLPAKDPVNVQGPLRQAAFSKGFGPPDGRTGLEPAPLCLWNCCPMAFSASSGFLPPPLVKNLGRVPAQRGLKLRPDAIAALRWCISNRIYQQIRPILCLQVMSEVCY